MIPEQFHLLDTIQDAMVGNALHKPVAFCLQDDLFVVRTLTVQIRCPGLSLSILFHLGRVFGDFVRGFLVSHYASEHRVDVLLVEPVEELGTLNPIGFLARKLSWPHAREGDVHSFKLGQECLVLLGIDILQKAFHVSVGREETFA